MPRSGRNDPVAAVHEGGPVRTRSTWVWLALLVAVAPSAALLFVGGTLPVLVKALSLLGFGSLALVGALFAAREPSNPIGWLLLIGSLGAGLNALTEGAALALVGDGRVLPVQPVLGLASVGYALQATAFSLVALLFPTGRLLSPRWKWALWFALASGVLSVMGAMAVSSQVSDLTSFLTYNWSLSQAGGDVAIAGQALFGVAVGCYTVGFCISLVALAFRLRVGSFVERQQVKWVVYTGCATAVLALVLMRLWSVDQAAGSMEVRMVYNGAAVGLIAVGFGIAIFRHHLYDIDRVVKLTVVYAIVVALLGIVYGALTLLAVTLFPDTGGLTVAVATLVVAALFNPLRRRVQARIERFFHRKQYDPDQVSLGLKRSIAREVRVDVIMSSFSVTVQETFKPRTMGSWIRKAGHPRSDR